MRLFGLYFTFLTRLLRFRGRFTGMPDIVVTRKTPAAGHMKADMVTVIVALRKGYGFSMRKASITLPSCMSSLYSVLQFATAAHAIIKLSQ